MPALHKLKNTILIGMPGVGKSTVGVVAAKRMGCRFATGGSVCYGREAMRHLQQLGIVVYLRLGCEALAERLGDLHERGVAMKEGQTLAKLYLERVPLYEKYADIVIDCEEKNLRETAEEVCRLVKLFRKEKGENF